MPQLSLAEPVLQRVRQRIYPVFECLLQRREPVNAAVEKMLEDTGPPANIHFNTGAPRDVVEVIPHILAERRFEVGRIDDAGRI